MKIMQPINIVIADDNRFFCEALKDSLQLHKEFNTINTFYSIKNLCEYTNRHSFDVLILDVNFNGQNSLDYICEIKPKLADFKIIALTTLNNNYIKNKALTNGIDYFIGKDSDLSLFKNVILNCHNSEKELNYISKKKITIDNLVFTERKLEVLQKLYDYANKKEKDIALLLHISESALKSHKRELFEITDTNNAPDLIKFGIQNGLIIS